MKAVIHESGDFGWKNANPAPPYMSTAKTAAAGGSSWSLRIGSRNMSAKKARQESRNSIKFLGPWTYRKRRNAAMADRTAIRSVNGRTARKAKMTVQAASLVLDVMFSIVWFIVFLRLVTKRNGKGAPFPNRLLSALLRSACGFRLSRRARSWKSCP